MADPGAPSAAGSPPAEPGVPGDGPAPLGRPLEKHDLRKLFEVWVDSDLKAQIVLFYNNNPGVVETMDGLARRLGTTVEAIRQHIADHIELGLLKTRQIGKKTVLIYDRDRRNDIEQFIIEQLRRRAAAEDAA